MREVKINTNKINFITVQNCTIEKEINTHGKATITGNVKAADEDTVNRMIDLDELVCISVLDELDSSNNIFCGVIESAAVKSVGGFKQVTLVLMGGTKVLDVAESIKTFQNQSMTYHSVINAINQNYSKISYIQGYNTQIPIDNIFVQYEETDWEFLMRIASNLNMCVYPNYKSKYISYYFGLEEGKVQGSLETIEYNLLNHLEEYRTKTGNNLNDIIAEDTWYYQVKSRDLYELGNCVEFNKKELYIYKIESRLEGAELLHTYYLKRAKGFKQIHVYNKKLIGASIEGNVISISSDKVKVHLSVDAAQEESTAKWFSYSTVYSSPDGTGWYCMPEKGDRVRLYFPTEKEEDGYVISSIHTGDSSDQKSARTNPDNKSISTKYGKQVELTPDSISITNNKGMSIVISDDEGITIQSDKDIIMESQGEFSIKSVTDKMNFEALDSIVLKQGNTKMIMKDDVTIEGAKVKMQ
ncbi:contractile injection system protein, VgrG/Pvc8 family [Lachnotalea glycerini]|uniref:Gp5/Type VI secretion system Vgr protein OB-fold domain-containing protein n=1 Tax=Lachnotalea glycerini TaxID=1763509 RepID=A0A371JHJ8_9FIRM|nr:contractile injection system protein, VgrG/Pvc8 family [Lachnotalea glycerini]RDY32215.1 hypothetical protein CG710_005920 [Lachnotalea glycerini]